MKHAYYRGIALLLLLLPGLAHAQNVGIGTTSPTQTLDVNGALRVRGLSGSAARLPQVQPDGTLGLLDTPASAGSAAASPLLLNANPPLGTTGGTATALDDDAGYLARNPRSIILLAGTILYTLGNEQLISYDVSDPTRPVKLSQLAIAGQSLRMTSIGTRLYIGGRNNPSIRVVDASQPTALVLQAAVPVLPGVGDVISALASSGNTLYVALRSGSGSLLQLYDTSTGALVALGSTSLPGLASFDLLVANSLAYLTTTTSAVSAAATGQLLAVDVSNPGSPVLRGAPAATNGAPHGLALRGTTAYVVTTAGSLQAFDVGAATPQLLATLPTGTQPADLAIAGTTAYVVNKGSATLQTFDISQPATPVFRGQATTDAGPLSVASDGQVAYVSALGPPPVLQAFSVNRVRPLGLSSDGSLAVGTAPTLSLSGQRLGISGGNTVTLPVQPPQTLSLNGLALSISGANTVTLPANDNLGNHTATQSLNLGTNYLVGNGGSLGLSITNTGQVGIGLPVASQQLELGGRVAPTLLLHSNTNSQLTGATLQFRERDLDYGWNLRHNTGASEGGSTTDRLLLERLNGSGPSTVMSWDQATGSVGIGTAAPAGALDVRGSATVSESVTTPKVLTPSTGPHNMVAVAYGTCRQDGTLLFSSGNVTVTVARLGLYVLALTGSDSTIPYIIQANPTNDGNAGTFIESYVTSLNNGDYTIYVDTYTLPSSRRAISHGFNFIIYQP